MYDVHRLANLVLRGVCTRVTVPQSARLLN
jgi:hypothetical protein